MTSRHLVAGLELSLDRDEDLHHFHDARRQVVASPDFLEFVRVARFKRRLLLVELRVQGFDRNRVLLVLQSQLPPLPP